eukprot:SAG31_NODE_2339_length_5920_cov_15.209414_6_plen_165_part_00
MTDVALFFVTCVLKWSGDDTIEVLADACIEEMEVATEVKVSLRSQKAADGVVALVPGELSLPAESAPPGSASMASACSTSTTTTTTSGCGTSSTCEPNVGVVNGRRNDSGDDSGDNSEDNGIGRVHGVDVAVEVLTFAHTVLVGHLEAMGFNRSVSTQAARLCG